MTTEEVLAHFEHVKAISGGWIVTCPAHDDSTASLSVSTGKDGRTLIHDHAGCDLDAILHAAGLTLADLFPPTNGNGHQPGRSPVVAEYLYRDVDGVVRYRKQRRADKKFFFARPDGHGGWITSREQNHNRPVMEGVERLVYRCNELREQSENASTEAFRVCIGEGCKDADRLWSIGLPATTNDGGAGKWTDALTAQLVAIGVTAVVCFPDNDDPGRAHMQDVARSCTAAGIEARIVALPDLPPKGGESPTTWTPATTRPTCSSSWRRRPSGRRARRRPAMRRRPRRQRRVCASKTSTPTCRCTPTSSARRARCGRRLP